ncbi:hypothetical protein D3C71_1348600 [compost metagenome]
MVAEGRSRIVPGFLATHAAGLAPFKIGIAIGGILIGVAVGVAMGFAIRVAPGASTLMGLPMRIAPSGVSTGVTFKVVVVAGGIPGVTVHCESPV